MFFIFNKFAKMLKTRFLALPLWCRLMWGKKSNLKQFNIRQQHNKREKKKLRGMNTFARHCMHVCIYLFVYLFL